MSTGPSPTLGLSGLALPSAVSFYRSKFIRLSSREPWRKFADEARSLAYDMKDEISKQMMLQIADDYERLAKRADWRAKL
jgi:hypothetical protein